jgi:hypothetical protein
MLDSRSSTGVSTSHVRFDLNQTLVNCHLLKVLSFTFGNSLYNFVAPFNVFQFNSTSLTVPEGYYNFADFINYVNNALMNDVLFTANLTIETAAITLNDENEADWTIGSNVLLPTSTVYSTFVLNPELSYTGDFHSEIFLCSPLAVALLSPNLQGENRYVSVSTNPIIGPFWVHEIRSPFGYLEFQKNDLVQTTQMSRNNISSFEIVVLDAMNQRELYEISNWVLLLEIHTS